MRGVGGWRAKAVVLVAVFVVGLLMSGTALGSPLRISRSSVRVDDPFAASLLGGSLSCPQSGFCVAVGIGGAKVLRDGVWESSVMPAQPWSEVSCASASYCVAVTAQGAVARYDGEAWSEVRAVGAPVISLSCAPGASFCVAGGEGRIYTSSGGAWAELDFSDMTPSGPHQPVVPIEISSVACVSTAFCLLVDQSGSSFSVDSQGEVRSVPGGPVHGSGGVACASEDFCVAVGLESVGQAVLSVYADGAWKPAQPVPGLSSVSAVSCPVDGLCEVVGNSPLANQQVVAYHNGTWGLPVILLNKSIAFPGSSGQVSCPAPTFCATSLDQLFAVYDGTVWSGPVALGGLVSDVSCVSATRCWAVDTSGRAIAYQDGRWSAPVAIDGVNDALQAISCAGALCMAVDDQGRAVAREGGQWQTPTPIASGDVLTSVSCVAARTCLAGASNGLVYRYSGGQWSRGRRVLSSRGTGVLVSCSTATFCAAVDSTGAARILLDGRWRRQIQLGRSAVVSISCTVHRFCAALINGRVRRYLAGRWHAPQGFDAGRGPFRVSCSAPESCVFADSYGNVVALIDGAFSKPLRVDARGTVLPALSCAGRGCVVIAENGDATGLQLRSQRRGRDSSVPMLTAAGRSKRQRSRPALRAMEVRRRRSE